MPERKQTKLRWNRISQGKIPKILQSPRIIGIFSVIWTKLIPIFTFQHHISALTSDSINGTYLYKTYISECNRKWTKTKELNLVFSFSILYYIFNSMLISSYGKYCSLAFEISMENSIGNSIDIQTNARVCIAIATNSKNRTTHTCQHAVYASMFYACNCIFPLSIMTVVYLKIAIIIL